MDIVCENCVDYLSRMPRAKCIFADPPDNIGLQYGSYRDNLPQRAYEDWLELVIRKSMDKCEVMWLSYHHSHDLAIGRIMSGILRDRTAWRWRKIIWRFTFGQYTDSMIANGHRPILMLHRQDARLYYDKIRTSSERMRLGDPRAAGLRIPDDVWEIPRVVGNSPERRPWHPTQHPQDLVDRILLLSCSYSERIVDLFGGSGTVAIAAQRLGIPWTSVEIDPEYCELLKKDLQKK